ncbi:MAG: Gfo/Idh/MocA family oxidoreductase [Bacteroidota bacterium]
MKLRFILFLTALTLTMTANGQNKPLKIGVIGLTHTHVHWIFNSVKKENFEIVGIVESNRELAQRYADQYAYPMERVYESMDDLIKNAKPEAVTAFGSIYEHLEVVETFAPLGIHVMVEKPLAVNLEHAEKMKALADQHNIHLLTNYETTWYPTNHKTQELIKKDSIGEIRKIIVRDGHKGPKKIGVNQEFLDWLTDPILNGGGAVIDFGCYGANLSTWLMNGKKPLSVLALTQQLQPENNPQVDDEAIIILNYENANAIIQASWNWPIGRKDMEVYGLDGVIYTDNRNDLRLRIPTGYDTFTEEKTNLGERKTPYHDPFALFVAVIREEIQLEPYDLSSLENNMVVMEILEAAIQSANSGKAIDLNK